MTTSATPYTTEDGDMIDLICHRHYGRTAGQVERVLDANRWLARHPPRLPRGLVIQLPAPQPALSRNALVRLWD